MRAYSRRDQQVKQFQKNSQSIQNGGIKLPLSSILFGPLALFVYWILDSLACYLRPVPGKRAVESGSYWALQAVFGLLIEPMWMMADLILVYQTGQMSYKKIKRSD